MIRIAKKVKYFNLELWKLWKTFMVFQSSRLRCGKRYKTSRGFDFSPEATGAPR
jgi:hypothetical protein